MRRVVITGMGAMTPLGTTLVDSWKALQSSGRAAGNTTAMTTLTEALQWQNLPEEQLAREVEVSKALPCQVAAPVKADESSSQWLRHDPRTPRFVQLTLAAGTEALQQAQLLTTTEENSDDNDKKISRICPSLVDPTRMGVCVGSGMSGVREIVEASRTLHERGLRRLSPHFVPKVLSNSAAGRLSLQYNLQGPNHSVSTACAAGAHALGDALRCLQYGNADIMLAGGTESCIDPLSLAGFSRLKALSTNFNDSPHEASRPFDADRDGFVMGEGAAILVLEELEHAKRRGAPILAELIGYGLTGDAHHITAPASDGGGAERAMRMALAQAAAAAMSDNNAVEFADLANRIGYVNAHATSTPKGDDIEGRCIDRLFGGTNTTTTTRQHPLYVSSTKGATGHMLGAAGAIEAAFTVLALQHQIIPPTHNLHTIEETEQLKGFEHVLHNSPVTLRETDSTMDFAMSNSFGFGGTNASIVLKRYDSTSN